MKTLPHFPLPPGPAAIISDLHLSEDTPDITGLFEHFCHKLTPHIETLVILGDFFEYWVGDDTSDPFHAHIATLLKILNERGTHIFFMPGNRDFLLGNTFLSRFNGTLLPDPCIIGWQDLNITLTHGDILCTDETGYQLYRKAVHNPLFQTLFLALPFTIRNKIGQKMRQRSTRASRKVYPDINSSARKKLLQKSQTELLIHGHTHRAGLHIDEEKGTTRLVLGDWHHTGTYIHLENDKLTFTLWR